jgi:hypothetical protein
MRKEGIANWTAEARAKSLATRRAKGSVWGLDHRTRADNTDKNTVDVASSPLPVTADPYTPPSLRARTVDDEMSFVDEEEYQAYLDDLAREKDGKNAIEMAMMAAIPVSGAVRAVESASLKVKSAIFARKTVSALSDVVNSQRSILTAYDLSAPLRQGAILGLTHPTVVPKAYANMLRAAKSETAAKAIADAIKQRRNYWLYEDAGLYLADAKEAGEEVFKSIFAKKIPGVNMSERAYNAYLNTMRVECFDSLLNALKAGGNTTATKAELTAVGNFVNVATGRGDIGYAQKYASELSTVFHAPKLTASRWQFLAGQPLYKGSMRTRLIISGEYGKFLAGMATLYGLAKMSGAEITWDTNSTDFGVIRYGNNRINPLAGLGKHAVFASRIITGKFVGASGKAESIYDDKGRNNWDDVTGRYIRSTLAPLYGTAYTLAKGRGIDGKPYNAGDVPYDLLPLSIRDVYEQYRDNPAGMATAMSLISLHGGGIDTYVKKEPRMTKAQVIKAIENGEAFDAASLYK